MRELAALVLASTSVAKVWALEHVSLGATCTFFAEAVEAKGSAHGGTWRCFRVSIRAVSLGAVALGKVQAVGDTFGGQVVRQIARLAMCTLAVLQVVLANSNLLRVVNVATPCTFLA